MRPAVLALAFLMAACASPGTEPGRKAADVCADSILVAVQSARDFAVQRKENMKVMRFGSETAMKAYVEETNRLTAEADRLQARLALLQDRYRVAPNGIKIPADQLTDEDVEAEIATADTCAAELLK